MGWESRRNGAGPYYIRTRKVHGHVIREYFGRGLAAQQAAQADAHQRAQHAAHRALRCHLETLEAQVNEWYQRIEDLTKASLLDANYHQHHRGEWRKRSAYPSLTTALARGESNWHTANVPWLAKPYALDNKDSSMADMATPQDLTASLQTLVQRGMGGDRTVRPALREILTTQPELWRHLRTLGMQVEQAWIAALSRTDLVTQEVLSQQLQVLKVELGGPSPTPLERLLVERIAVCWLQTCQADLQASHQLPEQETWLQQRQDRAQARLLAAIKTLAQVRKLLKPSATVQMTITQQHVNVG
jgi:hypothetical protein